jgi:histidine triad (HIT) family protein
MHNHAPPGYECFVCDLVAGEAGDSVVVTANEHALAIVSRRVWASGPGHVLVVLTRRIAIALKEAFGCDGTSTRQHNEPAGNQDLWHLHVHVFPRFEGDNLYGSGYRESTLDERLAFAATLQAVL